MARASKYTQRRINRYLYARVHEENHIFVADFFTPDDTFVADFAMRKGRISLDDFMVICEGYAAICL